jgi:hypothetical protein
MSNGFRFSPSRHGFLVHHRGKRLGEIIPAKETSGRHCFYLALDDRRSPRTYRGKLKAAEALRVIRKLTADSKRRKWSVEKLIVIAWDERPRASDAPSD